MIGFWCILCVPAFLASADSRKDLGARNVTVRPSKGSALLQSHLNVARDAHGSSRVDYIGENESLGSPLEDDLGDDEEEMEEFAENASDLLEGEVGEVDKTGSPTQEGEEKTEPDYADWDIVKSTPSPTTRAAPAVLAAEAVSGAKVCGFEDSGKPYCGQWMDATNDKMNWIRKSGRTPSWRTGPNRASQGRYYLYIEASRKRNGDNAILTTTTGKLGSDAYLKFDYHMYGRYIGKFQVRVGGAVLWEKTGDQGNKWHTAKVSLDKYDGKEMSIALNAVRGRSWAGDIALDAVTLDEGNAAAHTTDSTPAPAPRPAPTLAPTSAPSPPSKPAARKPAASKPPVPVTAARTTAALACSDDTARRRSNQPCSFFTKKRWGSSPCTEAASSRRRYCVLGCKEAKQYCKATCGLCPAGSTPAQAAPAAAVCAADVGVTKPGPAGCIPGPDRRRYCFIGVFQTKCQTSCSAEAGCKVSCSTLASASCATRADCTWTGYKCGIKWTGPGPAPTPAPTTAAQYTSMCTTCQCYDTKVRVKMGAGTQTMESCKALCSQNPDCLYFNFVLRAGSGRCYSCPAKGWKPNTWGASSADGIYAKTCSSLTSSSCSSRSDCAWTGGSCNQATCTPDDLSRRRSKGQADCTYLAKYCSYASMSRRRDLGGEAADTCQTTCSSSGFCKAPAGSPSTASPRRAITPSNISFRDEMGLSCSDWLGTSCTMARKWGYSLTGQWTLIENCGNECGKTENPRYDVGWARGKSPAFTAGCNWHYKVVTTRDECKIAMTALGLKQGLGMQSSRPFNDPMSPKGCYALRGTVQFNSQTTTENRFGYSPVCVVDANPSADLTSKAPTYTLVKIGHECGSKDSVLAATKCPLKTRHKDLESCSKAARALGGKFMIFGTGSSFGRCYVEKTISRDCPEGWHTGLFNFYELSGPTIQPTPAPTAMPSDVETWALAMHNKLRCKHCETPILTWSAQLASQAAACAASCPTGHTCDRKGAGENLYWKGASNAGAFRENQTAWDEGILAWYDEINDYSYATHKIRDNAIGTMVGHFTQIVWRESTQIGCAMNLKCNNMFGGMKNTAMVCHYAPAGNEMSSYASNVKQTVASGTCGGASSTCGSQSR